MAETGKIAMVAGVGPGIGAAMARRFRADGYRLALLARDASFSAKLAADLGDAKAYACDVGDSASVDAAMAGIRRDLGEPDVLLFNAGSGSFGGIDAITPEQFEASWRVTALGSLLLSQAVIPAMKAKGAGAIVFTGATASRRGGPRSAAFAPAKAAQRSLAESMARSLWPLGIHVALIIVDGVVDLPRTRERQPDKPDEHFIKPDGVASIAADLVAQDRSAWSFEVEARPFGESW